MEYEIIKHMAPIYLTKFHSGDVLAFGPVQLSQHGVAFDGKNLAIPEISSVGPIAGTKSFAIYHRDNWAKWSTFRFKAIPNAILLIHILRELSRPGAELGKLALRPQELDKEEAEIWRKTEAVGYVDVEKLGNPISASRLNPYSRRKSILNSLLAMAMLSGVISFLFFLLSIGSTNSAAERASLRALAAWPAAISAFLIVIFFIMMFSVKWPRFKFYRQGFVEINDGAGLMCAWSRIRDIEEVLSFKPKSVNGAVPTKQLVFENRVVRDDGRIFVFDDDLANLDILWRYILDAVFPRLVQESVKQLQSNRSQEFGVIRVSRQILEATGKQLAWTDYGCYELSGFDLLIYARHQIEPWLAIPLTKIVNARLLLHLINATQGPPDEPLDTGRSHPSNVIGELSRRTNLYRPDPSQDIQP